MTAALILYGSRARGDARPDSDVDVILAKEAGFPEPPKVTDGASVHFYPQSWLLAQAAEGNLFVGHLASEGVSIYDPDAFLEKLGAKFVMRGSYEQERRVASAMILLLGSRDWRLDHFLKRRFFWALRTLGIATAANSGKLVYSSPGLERALGIEGFADLIDRRDTATYAECRHLADALLRRHYAQDIGSLADATTLLINSGAIGRATVQMFELRQAQAEAEGVLYS